MSLLSKKLRKQNEKSDEQAAVRAAEYSAGTSAKSGLPESGNSGNRQERKSEMIRTIVRQNETIILAHIFGMSNAYLKCMNKSIKITYHKPI